RNSAISRKLPAFSPSGRSRNLINVSCVIWVAGAKRSVPRCSRASHPGHAALCPGHPSPSQGSVIGSRSAFAAGWARRLGPRRRRGGDVDRADAETDVVDQAPGSVLPQGGQERGLLKGRQLLEQRRMSDRHIEDPAAHLSDTSLPAAGFADGGVPCLLELLL